MTSSVYSTRSTFEYQTIQPYTGEPDYEAIKSAHDKVKASTVSLTSTLGGGNHGILGLMMLDATYLLVSTHAFVTPTNPGLLPIVSTDSTAANTYEILH